MRQFRIIILTLLPVFLITIRANSNPSVDIQEHYYSVSGKTVEEIRRSLNKNSPIIVNGKHFDAFTHWNVSWKFQFTAWQNNCTITKVTSTVKINHTMPRLTTPLTSKLHSKWQKYYHALLEHEKGHRNIGMQAAIEVQRGLTSIAPQPSCSKLERKANTLGKTIIKKHIALERRYDTKTRHGAADGAIFP